MGVGERLEERGQGRKKAGSEMPRIGAGPGSGAGEERMNSRDSGEEHSWNLSPIVGLHSSAKLVC